MVEELDEVAANSDLDNKSPSVWRNPHLWYIVILMVACSVLYYLGIILDLMGLTSPGWYSFLVTRELYLFLFSIPLLYAAYVFRLRGIIITSVAAILIFVPDAVLNAPYLNRFFSAVIFTVFVAVMGVLIAYVQNRRDQIARAYVLVKQSEGRFQTLFDAMSEGVILMDADGWVLKANPAAEHILGIEYSEIEGLAHSNLMFEGIRLDGSPLSLEEMTTERAMKEKQPVTGNVTGFKRPDGTTSWFIVNAIPLIDDHNDLSGVVTTFIDITERRKTEQQLLIAETAIRTCVSAIATADIDGRLTYVNPAFLKIWGYDDPVEVLGMSVVNLYKEEEKAEVIIQTLVKEGGTESAELLAKRNDGIEFIVGLRASLIVGAEGQPIGVTASLADITKRKKAEQRRE